MDDPNAKTDDKEAPKIDPSLNEKKSDPAGGSVPPVGPTGAGQRDDNETDSTRASDGTRKRAEEGL